MLPQKLAKRFPKGMLLDVGCRDRKQPNFLGLDSVARDGVDIVHDLEKFPYPIESESCLTIKCAHVIEHIKPWLVIPFMDELWRMLLPDGQLAISAPYAGSPGFWQDPTHCTAVTERTFLHFDPDVPLYQQYQPKPWRVEHSAYKPDGNIEAILRKRKSDSQTVALTLKAMQFGAIQKPTELSAMVSFLESKKLETVVEIGTARGGVFYVLTQLAASDAVLASIDLPDGIFGGGYTEEDQKKFRSWAKPGQRMHFLPKDSHKQSTKRELLKALGGRQVDLLFIDGDHTYEGVKADWEMYAPLVKDGGLVILHDICHHPTVPACQVEKLWKQLRGKYNVTELIDPNDVNWGGIGIVAYRRKA